MIYIARRYLGMTAQEWDRTPWWEQRALREGLVADGLIREIGASSEQGTTIADEHVYTDGAATITERKYEHDLSDMDSLPTGDYIVGTIG